MIVHNPIVSTVVHIESKKRQYEMSHKSSPSSHPLYVSMTSSSYETFDQRYIALQQRDPDSEGHFIYCVLSTNIYCRPTCSSRLPLRKNVVFCENVEEAVSRSFRPCKRCKPDIETGWNRTRECIVVACTVIGYMAQQDQKFDVDKVAANVGLSKWHFCRVFKNYTGYTPRKFYLQSRGGKITPQPLPLIRTKKFLQQKKREKIHEQIESLLRSLPDSLFNSENGGGDLVVGGDKAIVDDKFGGVDMIGKSGGKLGGDEAFAGDSTFGGDDIFGGDNTLGEHYKDQTFTGEDTFGGDTLGGQIFGGQTFGGLRGGAGHTRSIQTDTPTPTSNKDLSPILTTHIPIIESKQANSQVADCHAVCNSDEYTYPCERNQIELSQNSSQEELWLFHILEIPLIP